MNFAVTTATLYAGTPRYEEDPPKLTDQTAVNSQARRNSTVIFDLANSSARRREAIHTAVTGINDPKIVYKSPDIWIVFINCRLRDAGNKAIDEDNEWSNYQWLWFRGRQY